MTQCSTWQLFGSYCNCPLTQHTSLLTSHLKCGTAVYVDGRHGLICRKSISKMSWHSAVNDLLKQALQSVEIPSRLDLHCLANSNSWQQEACWVYSSPVIDRKISGMSLPLSKHIGSKSPKFGCHWTMVLSPTSQKLRRPSMPAWQWLSSTFHFMPFAIETLGDEAQNYVQELGLRITSAFGERRLTEFFWQCFSVTVLCGNASCVRRTVDSTTEKNVDTVFYLWLKRLLFVYLNNFVDIWLSLCAVLNYNWIIIAVKQIMR